MAVSELVLHAFARAFNVFAQPQQMVEIVARAPALISVKKTAGAGHDQRT